MATVASSFVYRRLHQKLLNSRIPHYSHLIRRKFSQTTKAESSTVVNGVQKEQVVIVGGGIAGLATAVSLHRLGVRSVVLEQAESLRTGGTSLTLSKNGWNVLDAIGVGNELRPQFLPIQGIALKTETGKELNSIRFKDVDQSQEVRPILRRSLLETLAKELPPDAISFSSRLEKIKRCENGETLLELVNGTKISSKVVIGCDGVHSPVAKWMGFSKPKYVGYCAFRGLGDYPDGQPYGSVVNYFYGRGVRAAYVPVSTTKVYWFVCFNSPSPGPTITNPSVLKTQAKGLIEKWPTEVTNVIDATPDDTIILNPLADRWLWPGLTPPASSHGVVLVGDAWHPMTPNLGQGACCALEDSVVLARKLAPAIKGGPPASVEEAMKSYEKERWRRVFPMAIRANMVGGIMQTENRMICAFRDKLLFPKANLAGMMAHTNFECEPLGQKPGTN